MPAHHGDAVEIGGAPQALKDAPRRTLRCDHGVDQGQRRPTHCRNVVDVRDRGRDAGTEWIALDERRGYRLPRGEDVIAWLSDCRGIVSGAPHPVARPEDLRDETEPGLGEPSAVLPKGPDDGVELTSRRGSHSTHLASRAAIQPRPRAEVRPVPWPTLRRRAVSAQQ